MKRATRIAGIWSTGLAHGAATRRILAVSALLLLTTPAVSQEFDLITPREDAPVRNADGSETFRLLPGECSDLEYFSDELQIMTSDCGRQRNRIEYYETSTASAGDRRLYEWEIFIPEDFSYSATNARLTVGQLETGTDMLYGFELNNGGYTFRAQTCIPVEEFGEWHSVAVRIQYDSTPRQSLRDQTPGVLVVECDGEVIVDGSGRPNLAEGSEIQFRYGLFGGMNIADTDNVSVSFRNVRITAW
ncbi:hypothetical protein [Nioella sp. MMSF_3534]|uniref:hypothetical protein n=1 Tax=Nioella sp. MMSF_3534 TaxID=3046720 RepID=UPI00273D4940|nr:hypothetical protein [Nioella sp. MMSF_3534]